jgi:hypothetical protein
MHRWLCGLLLLLGSCERRTFDYECSPGNYRFESESTGCVCVEYHWVCGVEGSSYAELTAAARERAGSGDSAPAETIPAEAEGSGPP